MVDLETFDETLAAARAAKHDDLEAWEAAKTEHAEYRRGIRLLGGNALGPPSMWTPDILAFIDANPDDPRVEALDPEVIEARRAQLDG